MPGFDRPVAEIQRGLTGVRILGCLVSILTFCFRRVAGSTIPENLSFADAYLPTKPPFPANGLALNCPHCGQSATYERCDLRYRALDSFVVPRI